MDLTETKLTSQQKFHGNIVDVFCDTVRLPNGQTAVREKVTHPGGVAILPLTDDGQVLLVEQFRYVVGQTLLEVPAGKLEPGEEPRPAALRELEEEVGVIPDRLEDLGWLYVSPGISTEVIHLYLATGLRPGVCHPDEEEFLAPHQIPFETLLNQVLQGELTDAKTVALVLKTALMKGREEFL